MDATKLWLHIRETTVVTRRRASPYLGRGISFFAGLVGSGFIIYVVGLLLWGTGP